MHRTYFSIWIALAAGWTAALFFHASIFGGVRWLAHTGQLRPAAVDVLMTLLCLGAAMHCATRVGKLPGKLTLLIILISSLCLFNVVGLYLVNSSNGRIFIESPVLMRPFFIVASILPTSTAFTSLIPGYISLLILPVGSLVMALISSGEDRTHRDVDVV